MVTHYTITNNISEDPRFLHVQSTVHIFSQVQSTVHIVYRKMFHKMYLGGWIVIVLIMSAE